MLDILGYKKQIKGGELIGMTEKLYSENELYHFGVKGMKWGVRRYRNPDGSLTDAGKKHVSKLNSAKEKVIEKSYAIGAHINPANFKYDVRRAFNNPNATNSMIAKYAENYAKEKGVLPTEPKAMKAIETMGIEKHKNAKYDNLNDVDISRLKKYTDSARYSRNINSYLAIGEPSGYEARAKALKETLRKNKIDNTTVYRSCNFKFSTNGLAKKLDTLSEDELTKMFSSFSKNYNGKKLNENRVFSTSTSPLFAIDTWRKVNPTAAKTYNTYLIINCKGASGVYADGRTTSGKRLVNTRANQEVILAPEKLQYRKLEYDKKRKMFAITVDAMG